MVAHTIRLVHCILFVCIDIEWKALPQNSICGANAFFFVIQPLNCRRNTQHTKRAYNDRVKFLSFMGWLGAMHIVIWQESQFTYQQMKLQIRKFKLNGHRTRIACLLEKRASFFYRMLSLSLVACVICQRAAKRFVLRSKYKCASNSCFVQNMKRLIDRRALDQYSLTYE